MSAHPLLAVIAELDALPLDASPARRAVLSARNRLVATLVHQTGSANGRETLADLLESAEALARAGIRLPFALRDADD